MEKGINILITLGIILITIGITFGIKSKYQNNTIKIITNGENTTFIENKKLKIKKESTGTIKIEITIEPGFYLIELNAPKEIELYKDKELTTKIAKIYKTYNTKKVEQLKIYYKNNGNDYQGNLKINIKKGNENGTIQNKAKQKEYFWQDTYRNKIETIEFLKEETEKCEENCFDISNDITKVYAKLIKNENHYDLKITSNTTVYLPKDTSYMFANFENLKTIKFNNINTTNIENMAYMFSNNPKLEQIDLSNFNTTNTNNMTGLFRNNINLKTIDISNFTFNENLEYNYIFKNINANSKVYVKTSFEQAWVFSLNIYIRPGTWTVKNIIIK